MASLNTTPAKPSEMLETQKFRSQMGQISRHSAVFFAGTMFTAAAGYLFKVYLARVLGAEALGLYALGMTIIGFVGVFNGLGLPQSATRFIAAYGATGRYDELRGFIIRAVTALLAANILLGSLVVFAGPWVAEHFYHTPALKNYLGLFAFIMGLGALTTFFGQVLQGYKDVSRRTVITNFIGTPLTMLLTIGLVFLGRGLWGYIFAQVMSAAVVLVLLLVAAWKLTPAASRKWLGRSGPFPQEVISFSAAVYGIDFLKFLLSQSDKILIGVYLSARDLGVYAVSAAIVAYVPIVLQSVNQIFSPTIAELHSSGQEVLLGRLFQTLTKWIIGLTLPLAGVVIVFARPIMGMFGPGFERGWPILVIGTFGQLVSCGVGSVGFLLLMSGNQNTLIRVQVAMAAYMVAMNVMLVPRWGIVGAAVAAATTNAATNILNLWAVRSKLRLSPYSGSYARLALPVIATVLVVLGCRVLLPVMHPQWVVIVMGAVLAYGVFVGAVLAFGLDADDHLIVTAMLTRGRGIFEKSKAGDQ
jgi:O-antigen/teichoic acid export membrane protein